MKPALLLVPFCLATALVGQTITATSTMQGGTTWSTPPPEAMSMLFDVTVTNPAGLMVTQFDVNTNAPNGSTGALTIYTSALSHNGNETNPSVWTQVATTTAVSLGSGGRSVAALPAPIHLAPGTHGVLMHFVSLNPVYTNSTAVGVPSPPVYSNADVAFDFTFGRVRPSLAIDPFGGTSAGASVRITNFVMYYNPGGLVSDFSASPTRGVSPLMVQFTSRAGSINPGGIVAHAWDVDGDGVIDYTVPNPIHTYTNCGDYTVSLTVVDLIGSTTMTRVDLIRTDVLTPIWTFQQTAPRTLQFTDQTTPVPTSWAWDLDGDGITDSTLQNPSFVYPSGCTEVSVSLTVTRACQPPLTSARRIVVAGGLETRFDGTTVITSTSVGGTNFFDVTITNPRGINVCALHVNSAVPSGSPVTVEVFVTGGSYVGNHTNFAVWRQIGQATVTSAGGGNRTFVPLPGFYLPPGSYGMAVHEIGHSPRYINVGALQTFTNADLSLTAGLVQSEPIFGAGSTFTPRIWNGAIYYTTANIVAEAGYGFLGNGCAGALGVPGNTATNLPRLGQALAVDLTNLPQNVAFLLLGFSRTQSVFGPLPLELTPAGAPGCRAQVSNDATLLLLGSGNTASFLLPIPNLPLFLSTQFYSQALVLDQAANALGAVVSDAAGVIVGQ